MNLLSRLFDRIRPAEGEARPPGDRRRRRHLARVASSRPGSSGDRRHDPARLARAVALAHSRVEPASSAVARLAAGGLGPAAIRERLRGVFPGHRVKRAVARLARRRAAGESPR